MSASSIKSPTPQQIRAARDNAGLTQSQAALIVYKTLNAWQKWEAGQREMDAALWELFLIKIDELKPDIEPDLIFV